MGIIGYGISFGIQRLAGSIYLNMFLFHLVTIPSKFITLWLINRYLCKSNRKAMNRNWSNQKANPALKTKTGNK